MHAGEVVRQSERNGSYRFFIAQAVTENQGNQNILPTEIILQLRG
jgi:hypothetical protein